MAIDFVVYDRPPERRSAQAERLSIRRDGRLYLSREVYAKLGQPQAVELLFARYGTRIGVRACEPTLPHARPITGRGDRQGGTVSVAIGDLLRYHEVKVALPISGTPGRQGQIVYLQLSKVAE